MLPKKRHSLDGLSGWMTSTGGKMNGKTPCSSIILNVISLMNQEISFEFESELSPNYWVQKPSKTLPAVNLLYHAVNLLYHKA